MPRGDRVGPPPEFWRCGACGTPNPRATYLKLCLSCGAPRSSTSHAPARNDLAGAIARRVAAIRTLGARSWNAARTWRPRPRACPKGWAAWIAWTCWAYAAVVVILVALLHGLGDRWWAATMLLFGPRWPASVPLIVLGPLAAWKSRRSLLVLAATAGLVIGPLMGACLSWRALTAPEGRDLGIRVLTCNTGGKLVNFVALADLIERVRPDVVALQEWTGSDPSLALPGRGWSVVRTDVQLLIACRLPILSSRLYSEAELGGDAMMLACVIDAPGGPLAVHVIHLETPREGIEAVLRNGWAGVPELRANIALRTQLSSACARVVAASGPRSLVLGDFNLPSESAIFRRDWSGYEDAFAVSGIGLGYTRQTRWFGARIDHILSGPGWHARSCRVGPDVDSDHLPVIADLESLGP